MMGDVNHDNASETGHGLKLSERINFGVSTGMKFLPENNRVPASGETTVPFPSVPALIVPALITQE
jgi:hypothetical protein